MTDNTETAPETLAQIHKDILDIEENNFSDIKNIMDRIVSAKEHFLAKAGQHDGVVNSDLMRKHDLLSQIVVEMRLASMGKPSNFEDFKKQLQNERGAEYAFTIDGKTHFQSNSIITTNKEMERFIKKDFLKWLEHKDGVQLKWIKRTEPEKDQTSYVTLNRIDLLKNDINNDKKKIIDIADTEHLAWQAQQEKQNRENDSKELLNTIENKEKEHIHGFTIGDCITKKSKAWSASLDKYNDLVDVDGMIVEINGDIARILPYQDLSPFWDNSQWEQHPNVDLTNSREVDLSFQDYIKAPIGNAKRQSPSLILKVNSNLNSGMYEQIMEASEENPMFEENKHKNMWTFKPENSSIDGRWKHMKMLRNNESLTEPVLYIKKDNLAGGRFFTWLSTRETYQDDDQSISAHNAWCIGSDGSLEEAKIRANNLVTELLDMEENRPKIKSEFKKASKEQVKNIPF